jgi:hypothetical protein
MLQYIKIIFKDFPQDHELFTLGIEFTTEDPNMRSPDIARIINVADAKGREHECILRIFIDSSDDDMSDSTPESDSNQGKHWVWVWIVFLSPSLIQSID